MRSIVSASPQVLGGLALLLLCACGDTSDDSSDDADTGSADTGSNTGDATTDTGAPGEDASPDFGERFSWGEPANFEPDPVFAQAHPAAFERTSGWVSHITGRPRPSTGRMGGFGTGNGHVFALAGYGSRVTDLHSLTGPTYDKREAFFSDHSLFLTRGGEPVAIDDEWIARSLSGPQLMTRTRADGLQLDTVDFAPWSNGPERFCFVRMIRVQASDGADTAQVGLRVQTVGATQELSDGIVEPREDRVLRTQFDVPAIPGNRTLDLALDELQPGGDAQVTLLHCATEGDTPAALPAVNAGSWLDATAAAWADWNDRLASFELPDPLLDDFVEGMKLTLITQTADTGATSPMSQYTRTWARDNIGPVLAWHAYGAFEEARATMDYIYGAVLEGGDFSNSYRADLDLSTLPEPPNWAELPVLGKSVGGETPSYIAWIYGDHARMTGDLSLADERWGFLDRALQAQRFTEDLLLPFTDDETYRAAMNAAHALNLEYPHSERNDSANSSFLWLGAAGRIIELLENMGRVDEAQELRQQYRAVEQATLATFLLDDGCFAAWRERSSGKISAPFEDVSLTLTWTGWLSGDDPMAQQNLQCLIDTLGGAPGVIRSHVARMYDRHPATGGGSELATGMLPGYALAAYTDTGHPHAEHALAEMGALASSSGNFQEYIVADKREGLSLLYDGSGTIGDYTAKYRPWEGGINVHAVLDFLFGARVNMLDSAVQLRPHLPTGWPWMRARALRIGEHRFDVEVERTALGARLEVRSQASIDLDLSVRWDHITDDFSASLDGESIPAGDIETLTSFGQTHAKLGPFVLGAGETLVLELSGTDPAPASLADRPDGE